MIDTVKLAERTLAPVRRYVEATPGNSRKLAEKVAKETGESVFRQNVEAWIHPDPEKRVQPRLGMGLALVRVAKKLERDEARKR